MKAAQAIAASLLVALGAMWFRSGESLDSSAFAQTISAVDAAQTVTWTGTVFWRATGKDGKRTWLKPERHLHAYRHPGLYRETTLGEDGNPQRISVRDVRAQRELVLDPKKKKAVLKMWAPDPSEGAPFAWVGDALGDRRLATGLSVKSLELVGAKQNGTGKANVFRITFSVGAPLTFDVWIDAESKQLLETHEPGSDTFDPTTAADRDNPPEAKPSRLTVAGRIESEIVLGAKLDPSLFSLDPPSGFELERLTPPTVTEDEMVEYLGATARFNGGTFPDRPFASGVDEKALAGDASKSREQKARNSALLKSPQDRSQVEQKMIELRAKYIGQGVLDLPVHRFVEDQTVPKSFCYLGTGVKIGQADRIVCWYKLKSTGEYRAVFGDLTIKDVSPQDLPLSVKP
jgi:hypothetical protein